MTETLWREQARCKQVETELSDVRLRMAAENAEVRALLDRDRAMNQVNVERTRTEVERMRDRQEREQRGQEERVLEGL